MVYIQGNYYTLYVMPVAAKATPKTINWDKARAYYLSGADVNLSDVARKFKVSRQTVSKYSVSGKWSEQKLTINQQVEEAFTETLAKMAIDARLQQATVGNAFLEMAQEALLERDKYDKRKIKVKDVKDLKDIALAGATLQKTGLGFDQEKPAANILVMVQTPQGTTLDITKVT